jgi:hypothetical protein
VLLQLQGTNAIPQLRPWALVGAGLWWEPPLMGALAGALTWWAPGGGGRGVSPSPMPMPIRCPCESLAVRAAGAGAGAGADARPLCLAPAIRRCLLIKKCVSNAVKTPQGAAAAGRRGVLMSVRTFRLATGFDKRAWVCFHPVEELRSVLLAEREVW